MRVIHTTHMSEICDLTTAGIRGRYGEISYTKSWCGFVNPGEATAAYQGWDEQVKAYITVLRWNPTSLTGTKMDSVLSFAPSLTPVKGRIKLINTNHRPEDVDEVERQIRLLVRDTAKKLQATNDCLHAERVEDLIHAEVCDVQSKCSPPFRLCDCTTSTHSFSSGLIRLGLSYCQRLIRIYIIQQTGGTKAGHLFLHYPWYDEDSGRGIAWRVLASPILQSLLGVLKREHVEGHIQDPRYLIEATGQGARALRRRPSAPRPLFELIFLYTDNDIRVWLLSNSRNDPLDLLVIESCQHQEEGRDETPASASGGHPFFDRMAWDRWGQWDDIRAGDDDDDDGSLNDGSGSQDEDNVNHSHHDDDRVPPGQVHSPGRCGRDIIQGDEVRFLLFSFNILSNHISRMTTGQW